MKSFTGSIIGLDLSLTSPAYVKLAFSDKLEIQQYGYITDRKKFVRIAKDPKCISYFCKGIDKESETRDIHIARRRYEISSKISSILLENSDPMLVSIEGYSYGVGSGHSSRLVEIAEVTGIIRNNLYTKNIPLRIYDPMTIKLFATDNGHAKKFQMVNAAKYEGFELEDSLFILGNKFANPLFARNDEAVYHDLAGPGVDIADAFHVANLARVELLLRNGILKLDSLTDRVRRVFLRTTKSNPENLLVSPFVCYGNEAIALPYAKEV